MDVDCLSSGLSVSIPTPAELRGSLEKHLQELVEAARQEAARRDAMLAQQSTVGRAGTYVGAALKSAGEALYEVARDALNLIGGLCEFQVNLSPQGLVSDLLAGQRIGTNAARAFGEAASMARNAADTANEAYEAVKALREDPETWEILERFVDGYVGATHSLVLTEAGGQLGTHLLFAAATGGVGGALGASRATILVGKVAKEMTAIAKVKNSLDVRMVIQQKLAAVVDVFARRYLNLPVVKTTIKSEQRNPLMAAGLWAPMLREVPFFGLSYYVERKLHPHVCSALAAIAPEAMAALGPGQTGEHKQHGKCAEPVAISRALKYADRQGLTPPAAAAALKGSYMLATRINLKGNPHRTSTSRRRGRAISFDRDDPNVYPDETKFGQTREACPSCSLLLRRLSVIDLGQIG